MTQRQRWPRWVYGHGVEPDVRFSFANERTFLAWIRTSLAFLAAGVAVDALPLSIPGGAVRWLTALLLVLGVVAAAAAWYRWGLAERAIRGAKPLPSTGFGLLLTVGLVVVGVVLLVAVS